MLYGELSRRALQRLVEALAVTVQPDRDFRQAEGLCADVHALLAEALRRKCTRLHSVFPQRGQPDIGGGQSNPEATPVRLCRAAACWIDSVMALADDSELDVARSDWDGQARLTGEIVAEAILDDAVLAGMIAGIRRL